MNNHNGTLNRDDLPFWFVYVHEFVPLYKNPERCTSTIQPFGMLMPINTKCIYRLSCLLEKLMFEFSQITSNYLYRNYKPHNFS